MSPHVFGLLLLLAVNSLRLAATLLQIPEDPTPAGQFFYELLRREEEEKMGQQIILHVVASAVALEALFY